MCRAGARVVQEKVLEQIQNERLTVFVVWLPRFPGDSRRVAEVANSLVPDKRAHHFWNGSASLGNLYGEVVDLPGNQDFAWDVYFVFGSKAKWEGEAPPAPDFWMHQLGPDTNEQPRLDGGRFRQSIENALAAHEPQ